MALRLSALVGWRVIFHDHFDGRMSRRCAGDGQRAQRTGEYSLDLEGVEQVSTISEVVDITSARYREDAQPQSMSESTWLRSTALFGGDPRRTSVRTLEHSIDNDGIHAS